MDETLTVAQFNEIINIQLQTIGMISVVGEITEKNITRNSGLMLTIKDEKESAILKLSGFAPRVKGVNAVDVGMKIVAAGVPQLYSPFGSFSLQVVSLVPHGEGSLKAAFERLKKLLETKGYFERTRKRELPRFVTKIALITADKSAAYTDFMKILKETETGLDIDFAPVSVQGRNAVDEIVRALEVIEEDAADCVVLTRGGGSLEDLIAFNSEEVANAVFACKVPVVCAVGHERDISISDMVADIVASTPSQAAYYLAEHNDQFIQGYEDQISNLKERIEGELTKYDYSDKLRMIEQRILNSLENFRLQVANYQGLLESYDPRQVLKRGYAVVRGKDKTIRTINDIKIDDDVQVRLSDGRFRAGVKEKFASK